MRKILKGNYKIKATRQKSGKASKSCVTELFERKALEKLGGSIAFVMKSDKFVWGADEEA